MIGKLMIITLMAASAASSASSGLGAVDDTQSLDESSVLTDLKTASGFSTDDYPKYASYEHATAMNGDLQALTVSDGAAGFTKTYFYFYHPSGYQLMYWDGSSYAQAGGYKLKLSFDGAYDDFERYDVTFLSSSSDGLFWKFRLDRTLNRTSSDTRGYRLASFEIMNADKSQSYAYALGDLFTVTGAGSSKTVTHQEFNVVSPDVIAWSYMISGKNSHSYDAYGGATPSASHDCYSIVYSMAFNVDSSYGECVGVSLSWRAQQVHFASGSTDETKITVDGVSPKDMKADFKAGSTKLVTGWDSGDASSAGFLYKLFTGWNNSGASDVTIDVLQRMKLLGNGGLYTDITKSDSDSNPYLMNTAVATAAMDLLKPGKDAYVLHFDVRDFDEVTTTNWLDIALLYTMPLALGIVGPIELIRYMNGDTTHTEIYGWDMDDVSILSLQMMKDGEVYTLAVSADSQSIEVSKTERNESTGSSDPIPWWLKVIAIAAVVGLVVYGFYALFLRRRAD